MLHKTLKETKTDDFTDQETVSASGTTTTPAAKLDAIKLWEEYNEDIDKNYDSFRSYTDCYFERCHLDAYSTHPKIIVQLGAAGGHFLLKEQHAGSKVIGYDYSHIAMAIMKVHEIPCRQIDLNQLDDTKTKLAYQDVLEKDLAEPCNIIAVRVLNYLDLEVANLLLKTLIELAKPGSTFFLISRYTENKTEKDRFALNYQAGFFANRSDMQVCLQTTSHSVLKQCQEELSKKAKLGDKACEDDLITLTELDDILVVRKLAM